MVWLPRLLCRIGHMASVRQETRRSGLLYVLREITLGMWPLPWRRASPADALAAATVAGQLKESAGCALCCLGDTMRPTASIGQPGARGVRILAIDGAPFTLITQLLKSLLTNVWQQLVSSTSNRAPHAVVVCHAVYSASPACCHAALRNTQHAAELCSASSMWRVRWGD